MDLALEVGVSPRHLSFVETGRSRASPELLLALAEHLEVPLRERNRLLLAGGYAPRFSHTALDAATMARVRGVLQRVLDSHDPYPGLVVDRAWNVVLANAATRRLIDGLPEHLLQPVVNVFRVCLHPDGLAGRTSNFEEWGRYLLDQLLRSARTATDEALEDLRAEVIRYPNVVALGSQRDRRNGEDPELLVPVRLEGTDGTLALFTTMTVFGTPQDVTLSELAVELFYPADQQSEDLLRRAADPLPSR